MSVLKLSKFSAIWHIYLLVSHVIPVKSGAHWHVNVLTPSIHVPPLRQGNEAHSSILTSQISPLNPSSQSHVNEFIPSVQLPSFWQGLGSQLSTATIKIAYFKWAVHYILVINTNLDSLYTLYLKIVRRELLK